MDVYIMVGLSEEEMWLVVIDYNIIVEVYKFFFFIDRVRYIRNEKKDREDKELDIGVDWKLEVYSRLGMIVEWDSKKYGLMVKYSKFVDNKKLEWCVVKVDDDVW